MELTGDWITKVSPKFVFDGRQKGVRSLHESVSLMSNVQVEDGRYAATPNPDSKRLKCIDLLAQARS